MFGKKSPGPGEVLCPHDGVLFDKVPGYEPQRGCPVCKAIGMYHLPIPKATKQIWFCAGCQQVGFVDVAHGADVMTVLRQLTGAHKQRSPKCKLPPGSLRVLNGSVEDMPRWAQSRARKLLK